MIPVPISPLELRQFGLLLKRVGADPGAFKLRMFRRANLQGLTVHVHGRGAATVYELGNGSQSWTTQFSSDLERGLFGAAGALPPSPETAQLLDQLRTRLAAEGLRGGLAFLNARVPHRFTGIFRRDGNLMRHVCLLDKRHSADSAVAPEIPVSASFGQFAMRDGLFVTVASGCDRRLEGHPYSGIIGCYIGVPILRSDASPYGTLCHLDFKSHDFDDEEFLLFERAAQLLPRFLQI